MSGDVLQQYKDYTAKASATTSKFASSLKSVAANIGIMLAINIAVKAATAIWDNFNTTVEEAESKLNETQSVISDLKAQITELESIDANALTQGQKDKLQNLKDQLEVQEQLEEIEKRRLARERVGNGNWADYFDDESYAHASVEIERVLNKYERDKNRRVIQYNNANEDVALKTVTLNSMKTNGMSEDVIEYQEKQLEKAVEEQRKSQENILELQNDLITQKAEVQSWLTEIQGYIDDGSLVGSDLTKAKEDIVTLNGQLETINKELEYTNTLLYGGDDSWQNVIAEKTKYSVENLLDNGFTEEELQILATLTFDKNASLVELREVLDASKDAVEDFGNKMSSLKSKFDYENLDGLESKISSVQSAYDTVISAMQQYNKQGYLDMDMVDSLIALDDAYINTLIDENGQLQYNSETFKQLAEIKLEEAKASLYQELCTELVRIKELDTALVTQELALANGTLTESAYETAKALYEEILAMGNANSELAKGKWEATQKKVALLDNQLKNVTTSTYNFAKSSSSASKSASKEFSETIDFFEERVENLNDAISLLDKNLENVSGSFAKNKLISAEIDLNAEKMNNYSDALAMYSQKASEALSSIPIDLRDKVVNGAVDLTTFIGDGSESVVESIKEYQKWSDKISDCQSELAELAETIRDLELEKFNNIMDDFQSQFDIRENSKSLIDKQIDLFREAGELIGESFYQTSIEQSQKQLQILEREKVALTEQLTSTLASGNIQRGTDEWVEMVGALSDLDGQILDCKTSIEEFDNAILDLHTEIFERIQNEFSNLNSELENLGGLFEDFDVADSDGVWSKEGLSRLGLLSQQYELARYQVEQYNIEIKKLNEDYANGKYSAIEYSDRLATLNENMWNAVNTAESMKDSIVELNEQRIDIQIEGIEKEKDAYRKVIDAQLELINSTEELIKKREDLEGKSKTVTDLERQIASMMHDDSQATIAKRLQLEEELAEAKKDLADTERQYSVEAQKDALEKQYENYESSRDAEIETLQESLENQETLIAESFNTVKQNANLIGQQITQTAKQHGVQVSNALTSSWKQGENAIASYGSVLSAQSSAFISNIIGVENEVWNLQAQANVTANSLAYMFATRADNLIGQLTSSYYSEQNLYNMTNALQSSLRNTLEGGYNVSSIVSSLNSIADAANSATNAIREMQSASGTKVNYAPTPTEIVVVEDKKIDVDEYMNNTLPSRNPSNAFNDTSALLGQNFTTISGNSNKNNSTNSATNGSVGNAISEYLKRIKGYASGTRNTKDGLIITDEEGYELKLPKLSSGNYTIANEGSQILTKAQTDNIFEWSKMNPVDLWNVPLANNLPKLPDIVRKETPTVNVHYDSFMTVNGDINDTNHFTKQIQSICNKEIEKDWKNFTHELKF